MLSRFTSTVCHKFAVSSARWDFKLLEIYIYIYIIGNGELVQKGLCVTRCAVSVAQRQHHESSIFHKKILKNFNIILNIVKFSWIRSWERVLWRLCVTRSAVSVFINITMRCPSFTYAIFQVYFDFIGIWSGHRCRNTSVSHAKRCLLLMANTMSR